MSALPIRLLTAVAAILVVTVLFLGECLEALDAEWGE